MTAVKEIIGEMTGATPEDIVVVEKAYEFSKKAHEGQKRYSGEPYFIHPEATAKTLAEYGMDATTIAAGLLHDAVEDGRVSREEMEKEFGKELLFIVDGVTKLGTHRYHGAERHAESLRRLLVATASDIRVLIVKLADQTQYADVGICAGTQASSHCTRNTRNLCSYRRSPRDGKDEKYA